MNQNPFVLDEFQSHAGSIEADPKAFAAGLALWVSIPRWFD